MYVTGCVSVALFVFAYFALLNSKVPGFIFVAVALSFLSVMTMYGPQASMIAEAFTPRLRYSGASIGYHFASIVAGLAPFISTWLFASYHSTIPISIYVVICAAISIFACCLLTGRAMENDSFEVDTSPRLAHRTAIRVGRPWCRFGGRGPLS